MFEFIIDDLDKQIKKREILISNAMRRKESYEKDLRIENENIEARKREIEVLNIAIKKLKEV